MYRMRRGGLDRGRDAFHHVGGFYPNLIRHRGYLVEAQEGTRYASRECFLQCMRVREGVISGEGRRREEWGEPSFGTEVVFMPCWKKYPFCTGCGGGCVCRTGKWRPRELFRIGKRNCSVNHERLGPISFTHDIRRCRIDLFPANLDEISAAWLTNHLRMMAHSKVMESLHQNSAKEVVDFIGRAAAEGSTRLVTLIQESPTMLTARKGLTSTPTPAPQRRPPPQLRHNPNQRPNQHHPPPRTDSPPQTSTPAPKPPSYPHSHARLAQPTPPTPTHPPLAHFWRSGRMTAPQKDGRPENEAAKNVDENRDLQAEEFLPVDEYVYVTGRWMAVF
ncbi:hypothetical protein BDK51DRAFT_31763 [Blyttiomyces helicus]|uniref:Uncharacterized protein n=1 Tax=Blyttiomyces helicus TaxID=388810 RepID=A0A4P9WEU1_9FUNG|nr:hypothetical protein BDK51DRAFT_31763 [Blyttiomyces helicus]|eukprot:RKO91134.1 hypothetical protein BDK51DRAFT_31763 [Blyttiomyces helicus]